MLKATYKDGVLEEHPIYGSSRLGEYIGGGMATKKRLGVKRYEISNHLGNVMTVIADHKVSEAGTTKAKVLTTNDYYPFGKEISSRSIRSSMPCRYGFNGKEKDPNMGVGIQYDYGFRIYNPDIARFLSIDPLTSEYPYYTPYQFAGNKPIRFIDLDGLEEYDTYLVTAPAVYNIPTLAVTAFYQLKHGIYNTASAILTSGKRARFKTNANGREIFETEYYDLQLEANLEGLAKGLITTALDVATLAGVQKIDPTDVINVKTNSKNQTIKTVREAVDDAFSNGYIFKEGVDLDLRGGRDNYNDALDYAFEQVEAVTGLKRGKDFEVTAWAKTKDGKSFPVEFSGTNSKGVKAEVNIDFSHSTDGTLNANHIGFKFGKKEEKVVGHILVDEVPAARTNKKTNGNP